MQGSNIPTPRPPALLSDEYRRLNAELHSREPAYGTTGRRYVEIIRRLAREHDARHVLDYGCGKQNLWKALKDEFEFRNYDPALPGLDAPPDPADLIACIDVLEHVEPDYLEKVISDLARLTLKVAFLTIATRPSGKQLADGTNPHRIIESPKWWGERLEEHFRIVKVEISNSENGLQAILEPLR